MITMTYKEYTAQIVYSEEDDCFIGDLVGIRDIVSFHGYLLTVGVNLGIFNGILWTVHINMSPLQG